MFRFLSITLAFLIAGLASRADEKSAPRQTLERLADNFPYLHWQDIVYDRTSNNSKEPDDVRYHQCLAELKSLKFPLAQVLPLLKHENPKVRTLAAILLFWRDDPKLLPAILTLSGDKAATIPAAVSLHGLGLGVGPKARPQLQPRAVQNIAVGLIDVYLQAAGKYYGLDDFEDYWLGRKDRRHCASWFAVRLARERGNIFPVQAERVERVKAVRRQIDELPKPYRHWVLLYLTCSDAHPEKEFATAEELIAGCKELGPESLLLLLQNKIPSDDPDLQSRKSNNFPYRSMMIFVLKHARELLRPQDAEKLLACEQWEMDYLKHGISDPALMSDWAVAAAELQPARAKEWLHAAFKRYAKAEHQRDFRGHLAGTLWRLVGPSEGPFLMDWFFTEPPRLGAPEYAKTRFLRELTQHHKPEAKQFLARLVADPRFENVDCLSLWACVETVSEIVGKSIVPDDSFQNARHPFGLLHFAPQLEKAKREYPKETAELLARLADWRKALRQATQAWGK